MSNDSKSVGTKFETDVVGFARGVGVEARRIARTVPDSGDVVLGRDEFVVQLKARRDGKSPLSLGAWLKAARGQAEAYAESNNLGTTPVPVLIVKNPRGRGSTGKIEDSFVVMYLKDWIEADA